MRTLEARPDAVLSASAAARRRRSARAAMRRSLLERAGRDERQSISNAMSHTPTWHPVIVALRTTIADVNQGRASAATLRAISRIRQRAGRSSCCMRFRSAPTSGCRSSSRPAGLAIHRAGPARVSRRRAGVRGPRPRGRDDRRLRRRRARADDAPRDRARGRRRPVDGRLRRVRDAAPRAGPRGGLRAGEHARGGGLAEGRAAATR